MPTDRLAKRRGKNEPKLLNLPDEQRSKSKKEKKSRPSRRAIGSLHPRQMEPVIIPGSRDSLFGTVRFTTRPKKPESGGSLVTHIYLFFPIFC